MQCSIGVVFFSLLSLYLSGVALAVPVPGPLQSSPIALSNNGKRLLNVNPAADTVTLFKVKANGSLQKIAEIPVGDEPNSVAIHPNNKKAYVANALSGTVSILNLTSQTVTNTINVGVEPRALVLSPNGTQLYVANSSSNTLTVVDTATKTILTNFDLSSYGTAPRAIAVTNDGDADDTDETIFVASFFAQLRAGKTALEEAQDDQREGRVAGISAATFAPLGFNPIHLGPIANTGFNSDGQLAPASGTTP